jgi:phosphohistidine phosphatase
MKKLYIIRHAKSSWKDLSLSDFGRPLNKRGIKDALIIGQMIKRENILPDIIISSPAKRANSTACIIANELEYTKSISFDSNIYEAGLSTLQNIIGHIDNTNESVFLFGHNPGLGMLADSLVGIYDNIPTCGVVAIEFTCSQWKDICTTNAKLMFFKFPKMYK